MSDDPFAFSSSSVLMLDFSSDQQQQVPMKKRELV
jgi:hypothetical protein